MSFNIELDLENVPFSRAIDLASTISGKNRKQVAEELGLCHATVIRYLNPNDENYNPPVWIIPDICKSLGNNILIEWLCAQIGGRLTFLEDVEKNAESTLTKMHSGYTKSLANSSLSTANQLRTEK